jgi:hypothetical protein
MMRGEVDDDLRRQQGQDFIMAVYASLGMWISNHLIQLLDVLIDTPFLQIMSGIPFSLSL